MHHGCRQTKNNSQTDPKKYSQIPKKLYTNPQKIIQRPKNKKIKKSQSTNIIKY
jgi:hypothetical protein